MNFVSFAFVALLGLTLVARFTVGRDGSRTPYFLALIASSLLFYGWHVPAYLVLLLFSTAVDFAVGRRVHASRDARVRRRWVAVSVAANLGLLGFYKYADFGIALAAGTAGRLGVDVDGWTPLGLVLPIGISFYTFQSMSYTIDVYRGRVAPVARFRDLLLYVSFFPQLVAGPIVRASDFLYQLRRRRRPRLRVWLEGGYQIVLGFFLKMVVADNLAAVVDPNWHQWLLEEGNGALALYLAVLFSCQIFADFAGYTCIARGVAYWLGFRLPINFDAPYIAASFREFWRRWHITLSTWLRDYLYVPLGGNRRGTARTAANLAIVMLLGGLWHGAALHFVAWGALHGLFLGFERVTGLARLRHPAARFAWACVVQGAVVVAWIFFRSARVSEAVGILNRIASGPWVPFDAAYLWSFAFALPVVILHLRALASQRWGLAPPGPIERAGAVGVMLYFIVTAHAQNQTFLYFQF